MGYFLPSEPYRPPRHSLGVGARAVTPFYESTHGGGNYGRELARIDLARAVVQNNTAHVVAQAQRDHDRRSLVLAERAARERERERQFQWAAARARVAPMEQQPIFVVHQVPAHHRPHPLAHHHQPYPGRMTYSNLQFGSSYI